MDRNIHRVVLRHDLIQSSSSRRTWIEIYTMIAFCVASTVVLLAEDVDRNLFIRLSPYIHHVVLLAEDVDRNIFNIIV